MAFLSKKEQTVINLVNASEHLPVQKREELVKEISFNARLRQDGHRAPVREFLSVICDFNNGKIAAALQ